MDEADVWLYPTNSEGAANSDACPDAEACSSIGKKWTRIYLSYFYIDNPGTLAHELAHYVFDIHDEYRIEGCGTNVPKGACIECEDFTARSSR